jgi:hypothetical protein
MEQKTEKSEKSESSESEPLAVKRRQGVECSWARIGQYGRPKTHMGAFDDRKK